MIDHHRMANFNFSTSTKKHKVCVQVCGKKLDCGHKCQNFCYACSKTRRCKACTQPCPLM